MVNRYFAIDSRSIVKIILEWNLGGVGVKCRWRRLMEELNGRWVVLTQMEQRGVGIQGRMEKLGRNDHMVSINRDMETVRGN